MTAVSLSTPFTTPIPGEPPAESDLTYRKNYQRMAEEVEKGRTLAGGASDWHFVLAEGTRTLQEDAKDLRVASWVVVAKASLDGWAGALDGLTAYAALLEGFWDVMLPTRPRARITLAEWLWEGLERALRARQPRPEERGVLEELREVTGRIDQVLADRLKQPSGGAGGFRRVVREALAALPEPAARPVIDRAPLAAAPLAADAAHELTVGVASPVAAVPVPAIEAPSATPASLDDADRIASSLREPIASLARYLRELAPTSPWPYRLARASAWFSIEDPPYVERGRTELRAPAASDRAALDRLASGGDWAELRDAAEAALVEHVFWLDVHRYTALALDSLGPAFAAARATVGRELVAFLDRVPGVEGFVFSNGTPLASPESLTWLERERGRLRGGGANAGGSPEVDREFQDLLAAARGRLSSEGEAALAEVLTAAQAPRSPSARFLATLSAARLALDASKRETAIALLERLYPEVDETLEGWQPAVCRDYFGAYLEALGTPAEGSSRRRRQTVLFRRLLAIDPALAFRYGAEK